MLISLKKIRRIFTEDYTNRLNIIWTDVILSWKLGILYPGEWKVRHRSHDPKVLKEYIYYDIRKKKL
jgi:hypothetical protein